MSQRGRWSRRESSAVRSSSSRAWLALAVLAIAVTGAGEVAAESEFKAAIPNAAKSDCNTCHTNGGDSPRNAFGLEVELLVAAQLPLAEWWPQLRDADSDGDGQTNAQELGDPCITWVQGAIPDRTTNISNPGVAADLSADPDACEDPPSGSGGSGSGGMGSGGAGAGGGNGNGMGNGNGNGNGNGTGSAAKLQDPDWTYASPQSGCHSGPSDDNQLGFWMLAIGALLMGRALRPDAGADEPRER